MFLLGLFACKRDKDSVPDTSGIELSFELKRFDRDLMALDTNNLVVGLELLQEKYPVLYPLVFSKILQLGVPDTKDAEFVHQVELFLKDKAIRFLMHRIDSLYRDMGRIERSFKSAFRFMRYYFPDAQIPDVYTMFSEYGVSNFIFSDRQGRDALGVGLDFFLGEDYPYQKIIPNNTAFSKYLTRSFNEDHLVRKALVPWIEDKLPRPQNRLLDKMLYEGKKLYFLKKLLPMTPDSVIFEYTPEELAFCRDNEKHMWSYFLEDGLLYNVEPFQINKYVNPAPHTSGMPPDAPGRTGAYIGYRIIRAYMRRHPQTDFSELLSMNDGQVLLEASRYNPARKS